jgi:DNA-directed RNA polymerase subunit K
MSYTRYERARILGARSLQLANGAPSFVDAEDETPINVAKKELEENRIPITVKR